MAMTTTSALRESDGRISQPELRELISDHHWHRLRHLFSSLHSSDVAEIISDLPAEDEGIALRLLPPRRIAQVFSYMDRGDQEQLIEMLTRDQLKNIVNRMTADDRTRLLDEMPPRVTRRLLEMLTPGELERARELLGYPENSAGRFMTPDYVALHPSMTAGRALDYLRRVARGKETLNVLYIIDDKGKLLEDIRLESLVLANPSEKILDITDPALVAVRATDDREDVVRSFERYDRIALPVIDVDGQMLGIITVDDILDVASAEATEDIQKLGGTETLDAPYLDVGTWSMIRKRGGWLAVLFVGEMLTATAMSFFEAEIAHAVVLALFVPLIISSGGNSGSQATSLIIRALALRELKLRDWYKVFGRELVSGLALGTMLGVIGLFRIVVWQRLGITNYGPHYLLVALTVFGSLIGVVMFGTLAGSMLPFILRRLGFDPATSSAPFVATLVDVTGLCIYFTVALLILKGTLL